MINLVEVNSITKVKWKLQIQMSIDNKDVQGFNQVKYSKDFKAFEIRIKRRVRMRKGQNSHSRLLKN